MPPADGSTHPETALTALARSIVEAQSAALTRPLRFTDKHEQLAAAFAEIDALPAHLIPRRTYSSICTDKGPGIIGAAAAAGAWKGEDR